MHTNRLSNEKSPYLLQHQHNPVNWYPWGEEAFEAARSQNKPIFLSIGYSTCYWCHVMESDSFEQEDVAEVLNRDFISIKVDREERPDVDSIYMKAVVTLSGHGGWPLSAFLTTDLKPFYGGTFFKREQFIPLLGKIAEAWKDQPDAIAKTADQLTEAIARELGTSDGGAPSDELLCRAFEGFSRTYDDVHGGFGAPPKFPPSGALMLLLRVHRRSGNIGALKMAEVTLEKMARGGINDQLGGGFHRYSTDGQWLVPHFEKMLYDNALLAAAYLDAYQATKNEMFADVARATLDYVLRDMSHSDGAYYSAEDAGEVGREGEFYVWTEAELSALLSADELSKVKLAYGVTARGNFEGKTTILNLQDSVPWAESKDPLIAAAFAKLFAARSARPRPHRDDKILTSWNGLMIAAMARGYQVLGDERYLFSAQKAAGFIHEQLYLDGKLLRRYRDGEARVNAFIDDYAFLIHGLLHLYEADFDESWIRWASVLQDRADSLFWDDSEPGYFFSANEDGSLITRQKEFFDDAEPSGNAVCALNLLRLSDFLLDPRYRERAEQIFSATYSLLERYPAGFANLLIAADYYLDSAKEIAIVGAKDTPEATAFLKILRSSFIPNKVVACAAAADESLIKLLNGKTFVGGKTTFHVCEQGACQLPTADAQEAFRQAASFKKYNCG